MNGKQRLATWAGIAVVILLAIIGTAVGYGSLNTSVNANASEIEKLRIYNETLITEIYQLNSKCASMETKLEMILEEVRELR